MDIELQMLIEQDIDLGIKNSLFYENEGQSHSRRESCLKLITKRNLNNEE